MRLIWLIPCHNHADTLAAVLEQLPRTVEGFDPPVIMVVDGGSRDGTSQIARAAGVQRVERLPRARPDAEICAEGLRRAIALDADAVVVIDPEGQYALDAIPALLAPIRIGSADLVVGDRGNQARAHASPHLRALYGGAVRLLRFLSGGAVPDPQCAFRAVSREAAIRLTTGVQHTYAEAVLRAAHLDLPMASVPVSITGTTRKRPSAARFIFRGAGALLRVLMSYQPFKMLAIPGSALCLGGALLAARFLYAYLDGRAPGMVQSLILATLLLSAGAFLVLCGVLAELLSANRALEEDLRARLMHLQRRLARTANTTDPAS